MIADAPDLAVQEIHRMTRRGRHDVRPKDIHRIEEANEGDRDLRFGRVGHAGLGNCSIGTRIPAHRKC